MDYNKMTVTELRAEMKKKGLPQQEKGKKFTKPELVARLEANDKENAPIEKNAIEVAPDVKPKETKTEEVIKNIVSENFGKFDNMSYDELRAEMWARKLEVRTSEGRPYNNQEMRERLKEYDEKKERIAGRQEVTFDMLVERYINRDRGFMQNVRIGNFVCFIHYVEASNGETYKRLRTAKIVAINRKKQLLKLETLGGTEIISNYDDVLYYIWEGRKFPKDIRAYRRDKRTHGGEQFLKEVFGNGEK